MEQNRHIARTPHLPLASGATLQNDSRRRTRKATRKPLPTGRISHLTIRCPGSVNRSKIRSLSSCEKPAARGWCHHSGVRHAVISGANLDTGQQSRFSPLAEDAPFANSNGCQCLLFCWLGSARHQRALSRSGSSSLVERSRTFVLYCSRGICFSLQIAECGRVRWRLCLILVSPALARCNRQTSNYNQWVFSHLALPRSIVAPALSAGKLRRGFPAWLALAHARLTLTPGRIALRDRDLWSIDRIHLALSCSKPPLGPRVIGSRDRPV